MHDGCKYMFLKQESLRAVLASKCCEASVEQGTLVHDTLDVHDVVGVAHIDQQRSSAALLHHTGLPL